MKEIKHIYIDGQFVEPHGAERFDLHNPASGDVIGHVRLGDAGDVPAAVAAARRAFPGLVAYDQGGERIALLHRLHDAMKARTGDLQEALIEEYGARIGNANWRATGRKSPSVMPHPMIARRR